MGLQARAGEYETPECMTKHMGSYGGYNTWRQSIAKSAGFCLDTMAGYGGRIEWTTQLFQLILNHSDCDGGYTIDQIPDFLVELHLIPETVVDKYGRSGKLIELCKHALKVKMPIIFE